MHKFQVHIVFTIIAALLLMLGLNTIPLFDWDELNFAESAREMVLTNNWLYTQVGFEPFWEKPPLFIWLQSMGIQMGGIHAWVFKLPNVLAGIISVNLVYHIGSQAGKRMLGTFWAIAILFSFAPFIYWKSGIIDPVFNLFIFLSIYKWYQISQAAINEERAHIYYLMSGIFLGLAVLTKGPVALLILGLVVLATTIFRSKWHEIFNGKIILFFIGFFAVLAFWIVPLIQANGQEFFKHFLEYQVTLFKGQIPDHNQPWFYHILVLLVLCFPSAILAMPHLVGNIVQDRNVDIWHLFMRSLFWIVLIIFSIATTKIIHYSSLCWWPLTYFGAYQVYLIYTNRGKFQYWLNIPLFFVGTTLMIALWAIPLIAIIRPIPIALLSKMDAFSSAILLSSEKWNWPTLIPATLFTFWFIPWIGMSFFGKKPNPIYLYVLSGTVALVAYFTLLPAVANALQGQITNTIKSYRKNGKFIETWGYKTYALYYYAELKPKDFEGLKPENPLDESVIYPKQESRRLHAHNPNNKQEMYVITKNTFKGDESFYQKFKDFQHVSGYVIWARK
jgi:hypothetical protein